MLFEILSKMGLVFNNMYAENESCLQTFDEHLIFIHECIYSGVH